MARDIDALASAALKHLRDRWWNASFTEFLRDTLRPRAGNRILDVGCGVGTAEVQLGLLHLPQVRLLGIDLIPARARAALMATRARNVRAAFAAADANALPFADASFDSTFCVAVLQHVRDIAGAVKECARVTKPGGRVLAVEPDNAARYWFSPLQSGRDAFELGTRFFRAIADARGDRTDTMVGPKMPAVLTREGLEPKSVQLFPVSLSQLGPPPASIWNARREAVQQAINRAPDESIRRLGADYLALIERYASDAQAAGPDFVEIQNTLLFATVAEKPED